MSLQPPDRLTEALQEIVGALIPRLKAELAYYALWECRVVSATPAAPPATAAPAVFLTPASVSVVPTDANGVAILGPQVSVPLRMGTDGAVSLPTPGSTVLVGFASADPSKPYIAMLDAQVGPSVSVALALRVLANANTATWVGATPFLAAVGTCG